MLQAFESAGLEYVLIGAAAMGFHGLIRATEDLDLVVRATPENIERLRAALREAYENDPQIDEISAADLLGEYPAVRYYPPSGDLYFDLLTRLGDAASFDTVDAEVKHLAGTPVRVATPAALYRLKKATVRAIDHQDAAALRDDSGCGTRIDMPVQKFRSIDDMNCAPEARDRMSDVERFLRHCARYRAIAPKDRPRGVFKFRSIDDRSRSHSPAPADR